MFLEALGTYMILVSSTVKEDQFLHLWLKFRRNIENGCFVGVYVDFQSELSIPYSVIKQFCRVKNTLINVVLCFSCKATPCLSWKTDWYLAVFRRSIDEALEFKDLLSFVLILIYINGLTASLAFLSLFTITSFPVKSRYQFVHIVAELHVRLFIYCSKCYHAKYSCNMYHCTLSRHVKIPI